MAEEKAPAQDGLNGDQVAQLVKQFADLKDQVSQLRFPEQTNGKLVSYTSNATANTDDPISHGLQRPIQGYIVVKQDKAASFYLSSTLPPTAEKLYLKCSTASVAATFYVF